MPSRTLKGRMVVLGITGSIAAYKACDLVRRLKDEACEVHCALTGEAQKFVTALTFSSLSGNPAATDLRDVSVWKTAHLDLAAKADIVIVAPATASFLAAL